MKGFLVWDRDEGVATERGGTCVSGLEGAEVLDLFAHVWLF